MRPRHLLALLAVAGCRFGGPTASAYEPVSFPEDATAEVHVTATSPQGDDGGATTPGEDGTPVVSDDGPNPGDDGGGFDAPVDVGDGGVCSPRVAVCDPVHDTGCNALQQCDVDPLRAGMPTGQCVFSSGMEGGVGACTVSIFTESCPARSTCVDGGCRSLCFCNADCPAGQCCNDRSGASGFTLCGSCS